MSTRVRDTAGTIDGDFVPRRRVDVAATTLDREAIIHDRARLFHLDPIATVVWECCDGTVSVDALSSELGAAFRIDAGTARRDVLAAVRALATDGLLAGIDGAPVDTSLDAPLEHGAPLDPVPDTDDELEVRFDVGGLVLGVSTDHASARAGLRAILAAHVTDARGEPAASYALSIADPTAAGEPTHPHVLFDQDGPLVETLDPHRILLALLTALAVHGDLAAAGVGALPAHVVGRDGSAVLVARDPGRELDGDAFARHGLAIADGTVAFVDGAGSVVVGAPGLDVDVAALGRLATELPAGRDAVIPLPWGRDRVVALATDVAADPGRALLLLGPLADDDTPAVSGADLALDALIGLLTTVPVVEVTSARSIAAAIGDPVR